MAGVREVQQDRPGCKGGFARACDLLPKELSTALFQFHRSLRYPLPSFQLPPAVSVHHYHHLFVLYPLPSPNSSTNQTGIFSSAAASLIFSQFQCSLALGLSTTTIIPRQNVPSETTLPALLDSLPEHNVRLETNPLPQPKKKFERLNNQKSSLPRRVCRCSPSHFKARSLIPLVPVSVVGIVSPLRPYAPPCVDRFLHATISRIDGHVL